MTAFLPTVTLTSLGSMRHSGGTEGLRVRELDCLLALSRPDPCLIQLSTGRLIQLGRERERENGGLTVYDEPRALVCSARFVCCLAGVQPAMV